MAGDVNPNQFTIYQGSGEWREYKQWERDFVL